MTPTLRRAAWTAALIVAAACADRQTPLEPGANPAPPSPALPEPASTALERARHERFARRFALALADDEFRAGIYTALRQSTEREGKVYFQRLLDEGNGRARGRLARLSLESEAALATDLNGAAPIEIYLPVPEHRRSWTGGRDVLVATVETDADAPIAYDLTGRRQRLDPKRPPGVPVIALVRAEQPFGLAPRNTAGPSMAASINTPGLHMTYASFVDTFEGWLKGGPEFEVHILGQDGTSTAMKSYQCAGAEAGGPYEFDQNSRDWSGRVLLFSQAQLDSYTQAHPGQSVRVFVLEDDDGACQIKMDSTRVASFFQQLRTTYGDLTGGKDKQQNAVRMFQRASSLLRLFKSAWSFITTQDDLVGNAIEDVVAREFYPGANWVVKGTNNETYGALRLEMR